MASTRWARGITGRVAFGCLFGVGLLAAACAPSSAPPVASPPPAARLRLPSSGPSGACNGIGQASTTTASADGLAVQAGDSLSPGAAAAAASEVATEAVADPAIPGDAGSVPLVVTSIDAEGRPDIRQVVADDPTSAAQRVRRVAVDTDRAGGDVIAVEADRAVQASSDPSVEPAGTIASQASTNDPIRSWQWALDQFDFQSSWARANGTGVCVAVVDSGVQIDHPDLTGRVVASRDFSGEGVQVAGDHGTHVAGIIAAVPDNGAGTVGAAPGVDLLNAKVLNGAGSGMESWVAAGITWSVDQGARVINLSLGSPCLVSTTNGCLSTTMRTAIDYARYHDVLVVSSAGNNGLTGNSWSSPAANDWPIATASVAQNGSRSWFSTQAPYVDVAAPGELIWSTIANSTYGVMSGTSMAAPYVTSLAALAIGAHPGESATQIRSRVIDTATDRGAPGIDTEYGRGVINPPAAIG